ncbi:hypothetical protein GMMP1_1520009 [Candidatus Magnetomoraceae bacterium gMMP-1]
MDLLFYLLCQLNQFIENLRKKLDKIIQWTNLEILILDFI